MGGDDLSDGLEDIDVEEEEEEEELDEIQEEKEQSGSAKRKHEATTQEQEEKRARKRARLKALKAMKKQQKASSEATGTKSIAGGPAEQQARFIWECCCTVLGTNPNPPQISAGDIADVKPVPQGKPGTGESLVAFIKQAVPDLQSLNDQGQRTKGAPLVIVISSSAVRANDLAKVMRSRWRNLKTAKLFAKHLKLQDQVKDLQNEYYAMAVGTPNRIKKLFDVGALSTGALRLLVLDVQQDKKSFHILSLPETKKDLASFLQVHILPELRSGGSSSDGGTCKVKIGLFDG